MRYAIAFISWLLLTGLTPPPSASMLSFMSGDWVAERGDAWTEEHWSTPRAGLSLGVGRSGHGEKIDSFEYMRIERGTDGRLTFLGSPGGAPAVAFPAIENGTSRLVFENPAHDFPVRISYSRSGNRLTATISGPGGTNAQSWVYRRVAR